MNVGMGECGGERQRLRSMPLYARAGMYGAAIAMLALVACEPVADVLSGGSRPPHEIYAESLRDAGLADRALGATWFASAERALEAPLPVTLPFRETGFFAGEAADARGYRIAARRGERLVATVTMEMEAPARLFVDLFRVLPDDPPTWDLVASADTVAPQITQQIDSDGIYILRLQPELLRDIRYVVTIQVEPSLAFPVDGHDGGDIRSGFGATRDGGARVHHGVDIFAPRGTPVLAATAGSAEAGTNRLGGKVVWQRVPGLGSLYYAHLDSQVVGERATVRVGDTLGFVGNTGNAVTTPPHLHFGIYARPGGPVDPLPFILEPERELPPMIPADVPLGGLVRTGGSGTVLRGGPKPGAAAVDTVPRGTIGRLVAGAGDWRRIELPNRVTGFVRSRELVPADSAASLRTRELAQATHLRSRPDSTALAVAELAPGTRVIVTGTFAGWERVVPADASLGSGWVPEG